MTTFRFELAIVFSYLLILTGCGKTEPDPPSTEAEMPVIEQMPTVNELAEWERKDAERASAKIALDAQLNLIDEARGRQDELLANLREMNRDAELKALAKQAERIERQQQMDMVLRQVEKYN